METHKRSVFRDYYYAGLDDTNEIMRVSFITRIKKELFKDFHLKIVYHSKHLLNVQ